MIYDGSTDVDIDSILLYEGIELGKDMMNTLYLSKRCGKYDVRPIFHDVDICLFMSCALRNHLNLLLELGVFLHDQELHLLVEGH